VDCALYIDEITIAYNLCRNCGAASKFSSYIVGIVSRIEGVVSTYLAWNLILLKEWYR